MRACWSSSDEKNEIMLKKSLLFLATTSLSYSNLQSRSFSHGISKMQVVRHDSLGGRGVTWIPSSGKYDGVVVWMHGLGDTADGWADAMPSLQTNNIKYILPTAKNRPITINGRYPMPDNTSPEDVEGFNESSTRINQIIQKEIDQGVSPQQIVVAGFSQGGALAFHVALRSNHVLGGVVALSTWVPFAKDYPAKLSDNARQLKILQVHGDEDQVVSYQWGQLSHNLLKSVITEAAVPPAFITIEGMGHSSHPKELAAQYHDRGTEHKHQIRGQTPHTDMDIEHGHRANSGIVVYHDEFAINLKGTINLCGVGESGGSEVCVCCVCAHAVLRALERNG
eukprot:scaffold651_cov174-Ochromonas_danica.AAC.20